MPVAGAVKIPVDALKFALTRSDTLVHPVIVVAVEVGMLCALVFWYSRASLALADNVVNAPPCAPLAISDVT